MTLEDLVKLSTLLHKFFKTYKVSAKRLNSSVDKAILELIPF